MSCLWGAVEHRVYCNEHRVYRNEQQCRVHACGMTWRESLLQWEPSPRRSGAVSGRAAPCRAEREAPPRRARRGVGPGEPQVPALAGEQGIRASPASPTRSTDSSSQPWNPSSGARVIKRCTNCESPLKKIKSSVSPPRPHACMRFPQEPLSWQSREPCAEPESPRGDKALLLEAAWGPRSQGTAGRAAGGGGSTADPSLVDQQNPSSPTVRAPA